MIHTCNYLYFGKSKHRMDCK